MKKKFAEVVNNNCDGNEDWCSLKRKLLDVASEVCYYTKSKPRYFEMCWWNKDMDVTVLRKELFRIWKQSRNEEDGKKYCEAKRDARRLVYMAMDENAWEG